MALIQVNNEKNEFSSKILNSVKDLKFVAHEPIHNKALNKSIKLFFISIHFILFLILFCIYQQQKKQQFVQLLNFNTKIKPNGQQRNN